MAYTNSSLVAYTRISPNRNSPRNQSITKITIHHMAGIMSVEDFGSLVANSARQMSANYAIGNDGRIGLFCPECDRSWCSSSAWNDNRAVTIEVSNSAYGDASGWPVGEAAYNSLIKLCVDICKRNDIKELKFTGDPSGSLTYHYMFAATACPGPWIKARTQEICSRVNAQLKTTETPAPVKFQKGDLVRIREGATYYGGSSIPAWVKNEQWYIDSIIGDRAVLGKNVNGDRNIQSPINTSNLIMVKSVSAKPAAPAGKLIRLTQGTPIYDGAGGKQISSVAITTDYTIVEEKTVKYGKLKSGVGWVKLD
ncbi:peptidoglycan recognition family protein [Ruminococcus sp.]|uniref:peptidoglycan recognition protein family protein n=1 Tax=Ruminococcus sp. TaxID=41978 RepID=UPI001B50A450|nr:peptidoglycan recognition family protein [Ruminococcus sp.]MBP5433678.1 N-acetylmuramoyl-L-alanine amidase [Ruminococcus sp.]